MNRITLKGLQVVLLLSILFFNFGFGVGIVQAAPPFNDDFDSPKIIASFPYSDNLDTSEATRAVDDPAVGDANNKPCEPPPYDHNLNPGLATVWYKYSTGSKDNFVSLDTIGSTSAGGHEYDTFIAVWTGTRGNLSLVGCDDDIDANLQSELVFKALANTTYHIEVAQYHGEQCNPYPICADTPSYNGGDLQFHVKQAMPDQWVGGVSVTSDKNVVAVGRPHVGNQVLAYNGLSTGSLQVYIPMLFKNAFGGTYNSAFYVQNVDDADTANISIKYYDSTGTLNCTKADTINPLSSKGYWVPSAVCDTGILPNTWVGGVVITSDQPLVAVGRPHIGTEVLSYNGLSNGSLSSYIPMLFKNAFGGTYNSAFYIQNVDNSNTASISIKYYDNAGVLKCTKTDTIAPLASKGYWAPAATCDTGSLPNSWVGGVVVTSNYDIVTVGRPHIGTEVLSYNGLSNGSLSSYIPMLFKNAFGGTYNSAFYVQNLDNSNTASISIKYYDNAGVLKCTKTDTIAPLASKGYWAPAATCNTGSLPFSWVGSVVVTSNYDIVAVGRPHIGNEILSYNGISGGNLNTYVPMLFKNAFDGTYNAAFYIQNTEASTASVTIKFYDSNGNLNCVREGNIPALSTVGYWLPSVTCTQ